ncbi:MAG: hypothetical protein IPK13_01625 [Deltaproteobacteria bacterium]|nr:hypothetical protein [Deltaproteobacteria bacterium]
MAREDEAVPSRRAQNTGAAPRERLAREAQQTRIGLDQKLDEAAPPPGGREAAQAVAPPSTAEIQAPDSSATAKASAVGYAPPFRVRSGGVRVATVEPGSPADQHGLSPGDHVIGAIAVKGVAPVLFASGLRPPETAEDSKPIDQPPTGILVKKPSGAVVPVVLAPSPGTVRARTPGWTLHGAKLVDEPGVFVDGVVRGKSASDNLQPGDQILRARVGRTWQDITPGNAVGMLITGKPDPLRIEVLRPGEAKTREVEIQREPLDTGDWIPESIESPEAKKLDAQFTTSNSLFLMQQGRTRKPVDDRFSEVLHQELFERIDPKKLYFTQEDVNALSKKRHLLDDELKRGDASFANLVQSRFEARAAERSRWTQESLARPLNLNRPVPIGSKRPDFPADNEEAKKLWDNEVKLQVMHHMAAGASEREAKELVQHYADEAERGARTHRGSAEATLLKTAGSVFDPHTSYTPPSEAARWAARLQRADKENTGIYFEKLSPGLFQVSAVDRNSSASKAGVRAGDVVTGVGRSNGSITKPTADEFSGPWADDIPSDTLTLRLRRPGAQGARTLDVSMPRTYVRERASGEIIKTGDGKRIGVLRIPSFYSDPEGKTSLSKDVDGILSRSEWTATDTLVLDLRHNGGGATNEALELSARFGIDGVVLTDDHGQPWAGGRVEKAYDRPVIAVADRATASASETFLRAFKDYGRGVVVGDQRTFGKGTYFGIMGATGLASLPPESDSRGAVHVTSGVAFGPDGVSPQGVGVPSDVLLPTLIGTRSARFGEEHLERAIPPQTSKPVPHQLFGHRATTDTVSSSLQAKLAVRQAAPGPAQDLAKAVQKAQEIEEAQQQPRRVNLQQLKREMNLRQDARAVLNEMGAGRPSAPSDYGQDSYSREILNIARDYAEIVGNRRPR